jgi:hypothetical protein
MGVINVYFHAANAEAALQADVMAHPVGFTTVEQNPSSRSGNWLP